jgi:hypothetical protein
MARTLLIWLILLVSPASHSQDSCASTSGKTKVSGRVFLVNTGFAPIPAFSFNSPIIISGLVIRRRWFSYEPDFALGFNGKPWIANSWFRFIIKDNEKLQLNAGINPFLFFRNRVDFEGDEIIQAQRNLCGGIIAKYKSHIPVIVEYRYNHGFDKQLSGHFISLSSNIPALGESIRFDISPQLFYFNFTGKMDGLFASTAMDVSYKTVPVSLYLMGVLPMAVNFPGTSFKWNIGIVYAF